MPIEERLHTASHGIGVLAALLVMVLAVAGVFADRAPAIGVYALTALVLFGASTAYHGVSGRWKPVLQKADHCAIYGLIAGTYTPFCVHTLGGSLGYGLLAIVWLLAALGITIELVRPVRSEGIALGLYLTMGWIGALAVGPLWSALSVPAMVLLVAGGVLYSAGTYFYVRDRRWDHGIWHVFVLVASIAHGVAITAFV